MPLHQISSKQPAGNSRGDASNSLVNLLQEKLPKCAQCSKCFTQPKQLKCFHSFCKECLGKSLIQAFEGNRITCPRCKRSTEIEEDVDELEDNFLLKSVSEEFECFNEGTIQCNNCVDSKSAAMACIDCSQYLCKDCFKSHQVLKTIRDTHKSFNIGSMVNLEKFEEYQKQKYAACSQHKENKKLLFCQVDWEPICQTCFFASEHKNHDVIPMEEHAKELMTNIDTEANSIAEKITRFRHENARLNESLKSTKTRLKASLELLQQEEDEALAMIQQKFAQIKKDCADKFEQLLTSQRLRIESIGSKISTLEAVLLEKAVICLLPISTAARKYLEDLKTQYSAVIEAPAPDMQSDVICGIKINKSIEVSEKYTFSSASWHQPPVASSMFSYNPRNTVPATQALFSSNPRNTAPAMQALFSSNPGNTAYATQNFFSSIPRKIAPTATVSSDIPKLPDYTPIFSSSSGSENDDDELMMIIDNRSLWLN